MFEYVSNDKRLLSAYYKIDEMNEMTNFTWAHHGYNHIMNVCNIALGIMKQLNYDEELIDAIMTAIFMHDLGCVEGKPNHNIKSYEIAKEYFENEKINSKYIDDILLSIKYHNNYRYLNNKIAPVLRLADKLDHTKERVTNAGKLVKGMKEYLYIETITIDINDKLIINFIISKGFDKIAFLNYYFTKKIIKSIRYFSKYLNKSYEILFNGKKQNL